MSVMEAMYEDASTKVRMNVSGAFNVKVGVHQGLVCSGSVVVTTYDFESGRLGSNP